MSASVRSGENVKTAQGPCAYVNTMHTWQRHAYSEPYGSGSGYAKMGSFLELLIFNAGVMAWTHSTGKGQ